MPYLTNYHVAEQPQLISRLPRPVIGMADVKSASQVPSVSSIETISKDFRIPRAIAKAHKAFKNACAPGYMRATKASKCRAATRAGTQVVSQPALVEKLSRPVVKRPVNPGLDKVQKLQQSVQLKILPVKAFFRGPPSFAQDAPESCFAVDRRLLAGEKARRLADIAAYRLRCFTQRPKEIFPLHPANSPASDLVPYEEWLEAHEESKISEMDLSIASFASEDVIMNSMIDEQCEVPASPSISFSDIDPVAVKAIAHQARSNDLTLVDSCWDEDIIMGSMIDEESESPDLYGISFSEIDSIAIEAIALQARSQDTAPPLNDWTEDAGHDISGFAATVMELTISEDDLLTGNIFKKLQPRRVRLSEMPKRPLVMKTRRVSKRGLSGGDCISSLWEMMADMRLFST